MYVGGWRGFPAPVRLDASPASLPRIQKYTISVANDNEARPDVLEGGSGGPAAGEGVPNRVRRAGGRPAGPT